MASKEYNTKEGLCVETNQFYNCGRRTQSVRAPNSNAQTGHIAQFLFSFLKTGQTQRHKRFFKHSSFHALTSCQQQRASNHVP